MRWLRYRLRVDLPFPLVGRGGKVGRDLVCLLRSLRFRRGRRRGVRVQRATLDLVLRCHDVAKRESASKLRMEEKDEEEEEGRTMMPTTR